MSGARRAGGRTRGLFAALGIGVALLLVRMAQLQLVEGALWAGEAASLVRRGERVPFTRGTIVDAQGTLLARDRAGYEIVLCYREFRRGHPLGQVAHARTALTGSTVTLAEARAALVPWARELVLLAPGAVAAFGRGEALGGVTPDAPPAAAAASGSEDRASRPQRAADLAYYATALIAGACAFDESERAGFARERRRVEHAFRSYWEIAGEVRPALAGRDPEEALTGFLLRADLDLEQLARALELPPGAQESGAHGSVAHGSGAAGLIDLLELVRAHVEDLCAARLFADVAGFAVGRIDPGALLARCDLDWLCAPLCWDEARLSRWPAGARAQFVGAWRQEYLAPAVAREIAAAAERAELSYDAAAAVERAADLLAACFAESGRIEAALAGAPAEPWREVEELALLDALDECFAARPSGALAERWEQPLLPFQEPDFRALDLAAGNPWCLLELFDSGAALGSGAARGAAGPAAAGGAGRFQAALALAGRERVPALAELVGSVLDGWDGALAARTTELLAELAVEAHAAGGRLAFAPARLEDVESRAQYLLRDYGSRAVEIRRDPPYELVFLLARYPERFPGFEARQTRSRERVREGAVDSGSGAHLPGALLVGAVAAAGRVQSPVAAATGAAATGDTGAEADAARLAELERMPERSEREEAELARLIGQELVSDQLVGSSGIERLFEPALRGRHGYLEHLGLEQLYGSGGGPRRLAEVADGRELRLTLDLAVQRAAERCLEHPARDPEVEKRDELWLENPVGAIVLVTLEGDVIAAASAPTWNSVIHADAPRQRQEVRERAFHQPFAQPPGSALKPFVAADALQRYALDPAATADCLTHDGAPASLYGVRCSESSGHGAGIELARALRVSCNCYFAWLGMHYSPSDMQAMLTTFGFGRPTGVTADGAWDGFEDVGRVDALDETRELALAANGLALIDATPAQVARAMAGLARGMLPELRLVSHVGGEPLERAPARPLGIAEVHLERVRAALHSVTSSPGGSAYRAFGEDPLAVSVAAKTGSADLESRPTNAERVRKHTWLAGYFPAEDPVAAFAVFCSDTRATSSHSAAWIGRDFLGDPALEAWCAAALAARSAAPAAAPAAPERAVHAATQEGR